MDTTTDRYDLTVIGAGLSGMAGALFAANRGLSVAQVGCAGESLFASGLFDLLGVHPTESRRLWKNPWMGIASLVQDIPKHPYAHLRLAAIRSAFEETLLFLQTQGLHYRRKTDSNIRIVTSIGSVKTTYCVPETMWPGVEAFEKKSPCLLVDFEGFREFSAVQMAATVSDQWPGIRTASISFPELTHSSQLAPERMAMTLEGADPRVILAQKIQPHIRKARVIGLPAVLGLYRAGEAHRHLTELLGVEVFEIPTIPVSAGGLRSMAAFSKGLFDKGVRAYPQSKVIAVGHEPGGGFLITLDNHNHTVLRSKGVILATGRFLGQGLCAERTHIRETVFSLPVYQPKTRSEWHRREFLDPKGHPINRAGLQTDPCFRPLDRSGSPAHPLLFAAGSILAHQDWIRMKCGAGLAFASAYGAVTAFAKLLGTEQ